MLCVCLLCFGCSHSEMLDGREVSDEKVELNFSVSIPESNAVTTRTFGEVATVQSLYVVVFDDNGYIVEYAKAGVFPQTGNDETPFKVSLHSSSEKRILHFIANYPEEKIKDLTFGSERDLIGRMEVSGEQDAYWQRVELADGIISDAVTSPKLKRIPLIRNFLKITVTSQASEFVFEGFSVIYTPDKGSVAPYNTNSGNFERFVKTGETGSTYQELTAARYRGYMPQKINWQHTDVENPVFQTEPFYMYERTQGVDKNSTYLLVKGKWRNSGVSTYYKIDIVYLNEVTKQPVYYNLLRNFHYNVTITSVASPGKTTSKEAADHPADNNLSSSVDVSHLSNISNGIARLFVSYTDTTLVTSDAVKLRFKFYPDIRNSAQDNSQIQLHLNDDTGQSLFTTTPVISSSDDPDGWRTVTLQPKTISGGGEEQQSVVLYSPTTSTQSGISRTVNFRLRQKYNVELSCSPQTVSTGIGRELDLKMTLPDEMPETMFPLNFLVESSPNSIYPNPTSEYMPVVTGYSIVAGKESSLSYGFMKTCTYEQYKGLTLTNGRRELTCHFKTNTSASAATIYVYNKYFEKKSVSFSNN